MTSPSVDEPARARAALALIPAEDYRTWVDMAFALKQGFGDAGYDIWDEWSRSAHNYSERAARATWRSASASGGKTLASLFWLAEQHGFDLKGSRVPGAVANGLMSPDRQALERRGQEAERERRKVRARHAAVALEAVSIWRWARPVGPEHPYLTRKQLKPTETLRELEAVELRALLGYEVSSEEEILTGRVLIVPVWRGEVLSTLELIDEHGRKSSLAGGAKKGGYWMTRPSSLNGETASPILIGEGMATVLSAHRATGWFAAAALSSGNLSEVAGILRERFADAGLIVLGDLGHGEESARQAAKHVAAQLALPVFAPHALIEGSRPTDFNDMAVLSGSAAVRRLLRDVAFREVVTADVTPEPDPIPSAEAWADKQKEGSEMGRVKEEMADDAGSTKRRKAAPKKAAPEAVEVSRAMPVSQGGQVPQASAESPPTEPPAAARTRREIGEALYGLDDVPQEMKTLAQHRFGAQIRMATPRENGGPYRGEVLNTEHYLIQEVATRSVVFHAKDRMEFVSDRLKWMDENQRMNGAEVQIGYDSDRPKVYQHNPARSESYNVVYRDHVGADHVVWGVDLERAVAESGARLGERVTLENLGKRWVSVKAPVVDAAGQVIGQEEKEVYRNTWQIDVERPEQSRSVQSTSRDGAADRAPGEIVSGAPPAPTRAPRHSRSEESVDTQRAMQLAVIVAAMRAQGFSDRSISRVEQHAGRMIDAFHAEGVRVPTPKVFDPKAPSARARHVRSAPDRGANREIERALSEPSAPPL